MARFIVFSGKKQSGKTTAANYTAELLKAEYVNQKEKEYWKSYKDDGDFSPSPRIGVPTNLIKITSFAEPIKEFCLNILDIREEQVYGTEEQKNSLTTYMWDTLPVIIRTKYGEAAPYPKNEETGLRMSGVYSRARRGKMTAREIMQVFGTDIMRECFDTDIWAKAPFIKKHTSKWVVIDDCRFPNEADIALKYGAILIRLDRCREDMDMHESEIAMNNYKDYHYIIKGDISVDELKNRIHGILLKEGIVSGT